MSQAMKTRTGWVAPIDPAVGFTVKGGQPSGMFIFDDGNFGIKLTYAGTGGDQLVLPADPAALRTLADAIRGFADDPEFF
jgi:hypothetical protein